MFHSSRPRNLRKNEGNFQLINELSWVHKKKYSCLRNLKGEIIICHCREHDTIIIFFWSWWNLWESCEASRCENFNYREKISFEFKDFKLKIQLEWLDYGTRVTLWILIWEISLVWKEIILPRKVRNYCFVNDFVRIVKTIYF